MKSDRNIEVSYDSNEEEDQAEVMALGEIDGTDESGINKLNLSLTLNPHTNNTV
jgi:hypothetical protein